MIDDLKEDIRVRHYEFLALMEDNLNVEMIHKDFSNLSKLDQLSSIREDLESIFDYLESTNKILGTIEYHHRLQDNSADSQKKKEIQTYIPTPPVNDEEIKQIRKENQELRNNIQTLTNGVSELINEIKKKEETYSRIPVSSRPQYRYSAPRTVESQQSFTSSAKPVDEEQKPRTIPHVENSASIPKIEESKPDEIEEATIEETIEEKKKR